MQPCPDDATPVAVGLARAARLDRLGRLDDARAAYLDVLRHDAGHAGALNALGLLLERTGFRAAARSAFARAVALHPDDPVSHGNLATLVLDDGDAPTARRHYERVLELDPHSAVAHQCLAILALREGRAADAARHARPGFADGPTVWPYRGSGVPVRVLVLQSALGGNVQLQRQLDDRVFAKSTLVAEFAGPRMPLPAGTLVVNAIGDADRCRAALRAAAALLRGRDVEVVNQPARVRATSRRANARRLADVPGVLAPAAVAFTRERLGRRDAPEALAAAGLGFPLIVRAAGHHTGRHCVRVDRPDDLAAAVEALPDEPLLAIAYVDLRDADGRFRKYRVMIVDGRLFPLHLAVSDRWMVHYYTADMERAENRALDAAFVTDPSGTLGAPALAALHAIARRLGLDYGGIDFGVAADGRLVVFEANATMVVPLPPSEPQWAYRRAAVARVDDALRAMLLRRAGIGR